MTMHTGMSRWTIQVSGALSDLSRIALELRNGDPCGVVRDESLYIESSEVDRAKSRIAAEWVAFDFTKLLLAVFEMNFGERAILHLISVRESGSDVNYRLPVRQNSEPTLFQQMIRLALDRPHARGAILAYASGGADGLFRAYEALTYEILNLGLTPSSTGVGTKQWLVENGWITEAEDDRFLSTVLHFRNYQDRQSAENALAIKEAQVLVRRILVNFLDHCLKTRTSAGEIGKRVPHAI